MLLNQFRRCLCSSKVLSQLGIAWLKCLWEILISRILHFLLYRMKLSCNFPTGFSFLCPWRGKFYERNLPCIMLRRTRHTDVLRYRFSRLLHVTRRLSGLTTFVLVMIRIFLLFGKILAEAEAEQRNWPVVKKKKEKSVQWSQSELNRIFRRPQVSIMNRRFMA